MRRITWGAHAPQRPASGVALQRRERPALSPDAPTGAGAHLPSLEADGPQEAQQTEQSKRPVHRGRHAGEPQQAPRQPDEEDVPHRNRRGVWGWEPPKAASEGNGPRRRPQRRLGRRLGEVAEAVGGGYCRLQMPLRLALGVRGTVGGHRLGALEGGGGGIPMHRGATVAAWRAHTVWDGPVQERQQPSL